MYSKTDIGKSKKLQRMEKEKMKSHRLEQG